MSCHVTIKESKKQRKQGNEINVHRLVVVGWVVVSCESFLGTALFFLLFFVDIAFVILTTEIWEWFAFEYCRVALL